MGWKEFVSRAGTCDHLITVITVNFGIRRSVCAECGGVDLTYEGPSGPGILFRIPAPAAGGRAW